MQNYTRFFRFYHHKTVTLQYGNKKSYKADLDRHWLKRFLIGLAIALSLFVAVLEFPVRYGGTDTEDDSMDDVLQEMAMRKKQERQDMIAVVEPSRPRKKQQQKIKVVDKIQKDLQNIADISKKRIVGDEEGNGEKNDKAEKPTIIRLLRWRWIWETIR